MKSDSCNSCLSRSQAQGDFFRGFRLGIPIALGYIPVAFTFGLVAVKGGIPIITAVLISMTNTTSAGQFAGVNMITQGASIIEVALTTLVVNLRYMLMSLSISQKLPEDMPASQKYLIAFGVTDEVFAISTMEEGDLSFPYMVGLISCPYGGWALGTILGAMSSSLLPPVIQDSMGIALYCMFIALVIPPVKESRVALKVTAIAVTISSLFTWVPLLNKLSGGWIIIIATMIACSFGAVFFPREEEDHE